MWWKEQNQQRRNQFKDLLFKTKQIEFILGSWAMNDEACPTHSAIINQFTLGHQWLNETFGIIPNIGWQIDPFGASSVIPTLYKEMGFKYHVIARIDHQLKERLRQNKSMEFIWRGSKNLGEKSDILTHILYDSYCNPSPFIWENTYFPGGNDYDEQKNPMVTQRNIDQVSRQFANVSRERANAYMTNNLMFTFGCDFTFRDSDRFFGNLTLIRDYINQRSDEFNLNIKFATLSEYFDALSRANPKLPLIQNTDFYPYADNDNSYWTGYFVSYPNQKYLARKAEAHERSAQFLSLISHIEKKTNITQNNLEILGLRESNGEFQHHDGITGTARLHVRNDYENKLNRGMKSADNIISRSLSAITQVAQFDRVSSIRLEEGKEINLLFFNNLGWERFDYVKLEINVNNVIVKNNGNIIPHQIDPKPEWEGNGYHLFFKVKVPALGYQTYTISTSKSSFNAGSFISNLNCNGLQCEYNKKDKKIKKKFEISLERYPSYEGLGQKSGAYIFRPQVQNSTAYPSDSRRREGHSVIQTFTKHTNFAYSVLQQYSTDDYFDLDLQVGPLPYNEEVIVKFKTDIQSNGKFYTDNNGLEMMQRQYRSTRSQRIASNYYPSQYSSFIHDDNVQFTIITDRTVAVSSLKNGEIEVMIHRRTLFDDARGVDEALDDRSIVKTRIRFFFSVMEESHLLRHQHTYFINFPLDIFSIQKLPLIQTYSFLKQQFPRNIHLMNFENILNKGENLLRFLHTFEKDEHRIYSRPQKVKLDDYFKFQIQKIESVSLSSIHSMKLEKLNQTIELSAMEIKTYRLKL